MSEVHAPSVVDNELQTVSPTSLEKHERCNRRWAFQKVFNREDPAGPAASAGTIVHSGIEKFMAGGALAELTVLQKNMIRFAPPALTPGVRMEVPIDTIGLKVEGVPVIGRIDVINDSGSWFDNEGVEHQMEPNEIEILDWKTTGSLEYAKTPNQMANTIQMRMYAKAALALRSVIDRVRVSHGYGQMKRKPDALKVSKILTVHEIETFWYSEIVPAVRVMKHTAAQTDFRRVAPNFTACHDYGKPCPFINDCSEDTLSAIIGTNSALPSTNNAVTGGNTMSLLSRFNDDGQRAAMQVPESVTQAAMASQRALHAEFTQEKVDKKIAEHNAAMAVLEASVLPPDAPPSDPVLAVQGAEGQFHKNAVGLYVVKDGQWTLAGAKSKADYEALVEGSRTSGGSPAVAPEPVKRGRGRPRKVEIQTNENLDPDAPNGIGGLDTDGKIRGPVIHNGAPVKHPEETKPPEPAGIMFWYNSIPSVPTQDLAGYVYEACAKLASNCNTADIRASEHEALRYGKWKGVLSAYVQQNPPPPNAYRLIGNDEIYEIVANALIPLCYLSTRGVK